MKAGSLRKIALPGKPRSTQFVGHTCLFTDGPTVAAWSFDGGELWRHPIGESEARERIQLDARGEVWLGSGRQLGRPGSDEVIELDAEIAAFACLPDGFLVGLGSRAFSVARVTRGGDLVWRTPIEPPRGIQFGGVVEMHASTGFAVREKKPWRPTSWMRIVRDPIVVGGQLAVIGVGEYSSGVCCRVALSLETGAIVWTTTPAPWSHVAWLGGAWFLGQQGYGAFELRKLGDDGAVLDTWASDGYVAHLPTGALHVVELDNASTARHVSALRPGGVVRHGPQLSGYYTSKPAMTGDGELLFWRADELHVVTADLEHEVLGRVPAGELEYPSRMHLAADGAIAFTLGAALWVAESRFRPG